MPLYNYRCEDCGQEEEIEHTIAECETVFVCLNIDCDAPGRMHRIIKKAPEVFFLGPGFASTDGIARPNEGRNPHNQNRYSG